jgi:hypothetical protein
MKWIRDVTMCTVAVLLAGVQATVMPDQDSAVWVQSIAAMQGSASDRSTEKEDTRPAVTGARAGRRRERSDLLSSTTLFRGAVSLAPRREAPPVTCMRQRLIDAQDSISLT